MHSPDISHHLRFHRYHSRITGFVDHVLCAQEIDLEHYIPGSQRISFYAAPVKELSGSPLIDTLSDLAGEARELSYEEALYHRLVDPHSSGVLILIGSLGAGKSTVVRYILHLFAQREGEIRAAYPCRCRPACLRRPIRIDNLHLRRETTLSKVQIAILRTLRFTIYNQLIDEWLTRNSVPNEAARRLDEGYVVLRRLLISNDILAFAAVEQPGSYPLKLHSEALALEEPLLTSVVTAETVAELVRAYKEAAHQIRNILADYESAVEPALDFTSLVLGFYLSRCAATHPNNLLILDNIDQLGTDYTDECVRNMHALAVQHPGLRVLIPLRPSSLGPFTLTANDYPHDIGYLFHYAPDCSLLIRDRLNRHVLTRSRADLAADRQFLPSEPAREEMVAFLAAIYIYALLLQGTDGQPSLHLDHHWLFSLRVGPRSLRHLRETIDTLVGASGRYAITQLRQYLRGLYREPELLQNITAKVGVRGAPTSIGLPYNILLGTLFGGWESEHSGKRLANLYEPTRTAGNPAWPSLTKIRILAMPGAGHRIRVRSIVDELARFGIPAEIVIEALNWLSAKDRPLVWLSHSNDLQSMSNDLNQYAVIDERGQHYFQRVLGDFEYITFCALQIPHSPMSLSQRSFQSRFDEFRRIITALGLTEWKQIALRQCLADTVAPPDTIYAGELFTLRILLAALERIIDDFVHLPDDGYQRGETHELLQAIGRMVLFWCDRYQLLFGGTGFLVRYQKLVTPVAAALRQFVTPHNTELETLSGLLEEQPVHAALEWHGRTRPLPAVEEAIADLASSNRGGIPVTSNFEELLRQHLPLLRQAWFFVTSRRGLCELLERRLPTFGDVQHGLRVLQEQLHDLMESMAVTSAATPESIKWLRAEARFLEEVARQLQDNEIVMNPDRLCDMAEMDGIKARVNSLMRAFARLGRRFGAERTEHLDIDWR